VPGEKLSTESTSEITQLSRARLSERRTGVGRSDCSCEHCGQEFVPYRRNQRFCPGGRCKRAYEHEHRKEIRPAGRGRPRPDRFECGAEIAKHTDLACMVKDHPTRQEAVLAALKEYLSD
jgi:hypothetical protein